jgi:Protein of unknown function (DUF1524)
MIRRALLLPLLVTTLVVGLLGAAPGAASAETLRLREAVRSLPQAAETPAGYDRDLFEHWVDADGDCQDTREEVLLAESKVPISGCTVTTGRWFSWYDEETWTQASDVDIDHVVALKEAWDSGAREWDDDTRELYANDLGDPRSLVGVTDNVNQSKSDRDPAEWLPEFKVCQYVRHWVVVKLRWRLAVDPTERTALRDLAGNCRNRQLTFQRALPATG